MHIGWKIAAGIGILAGVGILGYRSLGVSQIETRLEQITLLAAARGHEVIYADSEITALPWQHEIVLNEVILRSKGGTFTVRFPRLVGEYFLTESDSFTVTLPPAFVIEYVDGARADAGEVDESAEPRIVQVDLDAEAARIVLSELDTVRPVITLTGDSLVAAHTLEPPHGDGALALELAGFDLRSPVPTNAAEPVVELAGQIDFADFGMALQNALGQTVVTEAQYEDLRITGSLELERKSAPGIPAMTVNIGAGRSLSAYAVKSGPEGGPEIRPGAAGSVTATSGATSTIVKLADGQLEFRAESSANRFDLVPEDDSVKFRGGLGLDNADIVYKAPLEAVEQMQPFEAKLALSGLEPDETLWSALDSDGKIDRSRVDIVADLDGTMRVRDVPVAGTSQKIPEFGNVRINRVDLEGLGASASLRGAVEVLQPINQPIGTVTVEMSNVLELVSQLVDAGILKPQVLFMTTLMSQTYMIADPETGDLSAEIEFAEDGYRINGQKLQ